MFRPLHVMSWASVNAERPIRSIPSEFDTVTLVFGSKADEFEFTLDISALRTLIAVGTEALASVDARDEF